MRTFSLAVILLILLASPASADQKQRHIEDRLDYWVEFAEDLDYYVIDTRIDDISENRALRYSLPPGEYHVYAEGGQNISDLDMTVIDDDGWELGFDSMADNFPTVSFHLDSWGDIEINLEVWNREGWDSSDNYCFVLSREDGPGSYGRDRDRDRYDRDDSRGDDEWWGDDERHDNGRRDWGRGHGRDNRENRDNRNDDENSYDDRDFRDRFDDFTSEWSDWWSDWDRNYRYGFGQDIPRWQRRDIVTNKLDHLYDFADNRGHMPIYDFVEELDDSISYSFDLDPGYYVVFAAGGPYIEDLDLKINWVSGHRDRQIAEDVGIDAYPAVWFFIPDPATIEIEMEIYRFSGTHFDDYACLLLCRG